MRIMYGGRGGVVTLYDIWFDGAGKIHRISDMDDAYIENCLRQLYKWKSDWDSVELEDLTPAEIKRASDPGMKAWFVINGKKYIDTFKKELLLREGGTDGIA